MKLILGRLAIQMVDDHVLKIGLRQRHAQTQGRQCLVQVLRPVLSMTGKDVSLFSKSARPAGVVASS